METRSDQVSVEGDVDIHVVAVNGVLPFPLIESNPHLVVQSQVQHHALALHDGALAGLRVQDDLLLVVVHQVEVGLLEVPGVDVDVEEVDPRHVAVELALEHVEVLVDVDEDRVENQRLIIVQAVQGLPTPDREEGGRDLAGVSRGSCLALAAFGTDQSSVSMGALQPWFPWCTSVTFFSFVTWWRKAEYGLMKETEMSNPNINSRNLFYSPVLRPA